MTANFWENPLFGLGLSILAYYLGMRLNRRWPHPLTTPLLIATILIIVVPAFLITLITWEAVILTR